MARVGTQYPVRATKPQVAGFRNRVFGQIGDDVFRGVRLVAEQECVDLASVEAGQRKVEVQFLEVEQFERQKLRVPVGPVHGAVHQQPEGFDLRVGPVVTRDHGHLGHSQFLGGFYAQMAVDYVASAAGEDRDLEAELPDRRHHPIDGVVVLVQAQR